MAVAASDIAYYKSLVVADAGSNGGRKSTVPIQSGVRHSLFPRVTKADRVAGLTRYRKQYLANENTDDDPAYDAQICIEHPSTAGDRFYLGIGTQVDIQSGLSAYAPAWIGSGKLHTSLTAGVSTTVVLEMESDDFQFPNSGTLHIADKFMASQTIASGVNIGDSVTYSTGTWIKATATDDIAYPAGLYLGDNLVMTIQGSSNEEWLTLADNLTEDEDIGTGNGSSTAPTLSSLANGTNGICRQPGKLPVVTATCGSTERTVNVAADGTCSGYCSAGELDMTDGSWTTDITWTTAPDSSTDITITYRENCFAYSGNNATVELESGETPANSYSTSNTYGGGCISAGDVEPSVSGWTETSTGGTYDESTYPLTLSNLGTVYDTWTVTFTGTGVFSISGAVTGSVATGQSVSSDVAPTNPNTGEAYFTLLSDGWAGTWTTGNTITFTTSPAAVPLWLKQVVPAGTSAAASNLVTLGWFSS